MQQEIFLGAVDAHYDELTERFTVVNLFGGEIMELFHQQGNVLPNQVEPFGFMDFQGHSVSNILIGDEVSAFYASSFPPLFSRPLILPGDVIQMSALQITEDLPQVLPVDPIEILQQADLPPVFVEANGLPVIRPTSTISPFTNQLLISAPFDVELQIFLLPDTLLGTVMMGDATQQIFDFTQVLVPGDQLIIVNTGTGIE